MARNIFEISRGFVLINNWRQCRLSYLYFVTFRNYGKSIDPTSGGPFARVIMFYVQYKVLDVVFMVLRWKHYCYNTKITSQFCLKCTVSWRTLYGVFLWSMW